MSSANNVESAVPTLNSPNPSLITIHQPFPRSQVQLGNANPVDFYLGLQNGGANADGIAIFDVPVASITSTTVPDWVLASHFWGVALLI